MRGVVWCWLQKTFSQTHKTQNQFMKNSFVNVRICGCDSVSRLGEQHFHDSISASRGRIVRRKQTHRVNQIDLFKDGAYNWDITAEPRQSFNPQPKSNTENRFKLPLRIEKSLCFMFLLSFKIKMFIFRIIYSIIFLSALCRQILAMMTLFPCGFEKDAHATRRLEHINPRGKALHIIM